MILRVPQWEGLAWLEHGFGTRHAERWTHTPGRATVRQEHSSTILIVDRPGDAGPGDALITVSAGVLLEIRTADCLPILLVDPVRHVVAAVHAGWRGTEARIVAGTVGAMVSRFDSDARQLQAAIGPGIEQCCFEVGEEVAERFGLQGRVNLNLVELNRQQLLDAGLTGEFIFRVGGCTRCDSERYHSFRRDRALAGRMEAAIAIRAGQKETARTEARAE
jgi:YfiH family protein